MQIQLIHRQQQQEHRQKKTTETNQKFPEIKIESKQNDEYNTNEANTTLVGDATTTIYSPKDEKTKGSTFSGKKRKFTAINTTNAENETEGVPQAPKPKKQKKRAIKRFTTSNERYKCKPI